MKSKLIVVVAVVALAISALAVVGCSSETSTGNYMDSLKLESKDVMNGADSQVIGQYGYVKADEEKLKQVSKADFQAWVQANVEGQSQTYNWVTIDFGNGLGIQWAGCVTNFGSPMGSIDEQGCLTSGSEQNFEDILS